MQMIKTLISSIGYRIRFNDNFLVRMFSNIQPIDTQPNDTQPIPAARGYPLVGTLFSLLKAGGSPYLHLYIDKRHEELGPIFSDKIGPVEGIFISDPNIMFKIYGCEGKHPVHILPDSWVLFNKKYGCKRGLYFMDGEEWLYYRRIMNTVLLKDFQKFDVNVVQRDVINEWFDTWKNLGGKDVEVNDSQFYKLSTAYIVASLVGTNYLNHKQLFLEPIDVLSTYVRNIFGESCKLNLMAAKWARFIRFQSWNNFVAVVTKALNAGDEIAKNMIQLASDDSILKALIDKNVPEDILRRIIVDLILAASDTTAFSTQWAIYLLSRNPEAQMKLIENPNNEQYLSCIIKETLRLYPAAPFITRKIPNDMEALGYHIPAGKMLIMSVYTSGRNPKYFPEPEKFNPDRWLREVKPGGPPMGSYRGVLQPRASTPFALGIRSCIGRKLAIQQMTMTLSKIAETYYMESLGEIEMHLQFVPVPKNPMHIRFSSVQKTK